MIYRIFTHMCRFTHKVEPAEWLLDEACLEPHKHGLPPNPLCKFEIRVATAETIDFKLIKKIALDAIAKCATKVINKEEEDANGNLMVPAYYDFGTIITENLVDDIKKLVFTELDTQGKYPIRVQVLLNETRKYSVFDDGTILQTDDDEEIL